MKGTIERLIEAIDKRLGKLDERSFKLIKRNAKTVLILECAIRKDELRRFKNVEMGIYD